MDISFSSSRIGCGHSNKAHSSGWLGCLFAWFIQVVKQTNKMHIVPVRVIIELVHLVPENAALDRINSMWLVNNHVDLNTNRIVY